MQPSECLHRSGSRRACFPNVPLPYKRILGGAVVESTIVGFQRQEVCPLRQNHWTMGHTHDSCVIEFTRINTCLMQRKSSESSMCTRRSVLLCAPMPLSLLGIIFLTATSGIIHQAWFSPGHVLLLSLQVKCSRQQTIPPGC